MFPGEKHAIRTLLDVTLQKMLQSSDMHPELWNMWVETWLIIYINVQFACIEIQIYLIFRFLFVCFRLTHFDFLICRREHIAIHFCVRLSIVFHWTRRTKNKCNKLLIMIWIRDRSFTNRIDISPSCRQSQLSPHTNFMLYTFGDIWIF